MEIRLLILTAGLGLLHVLIASAMATKARGVQWNLSSRETPAPPLTGAAGRLQRAQANFFETFPLFLAVVVALRFGEVSNAVTITAAWMYFLSRLIYLPIYAMGITVIRTLVWLVGLLGVAILIGEGILAMMVLSGRGL